MDSDPDKYKVLTASLSVTDDIVLHADLVDVAHKLSVKVGDLMRRDKSFRPTGGVSTCRVGALIVMSQAMVRQV